jgi:ATP/maltotriose-dependent transcriptional regulator MalT
LTRREREILQLLSMGLSNQEMAEKLVIAEGTLKRHVANLYQKLGVHNRTQAVRHFHQQP